MFGTFEMAVVEWEADAVEPKVLKKSSVRILEERLKKLYHAGAQPHLGGIHC